MNIYNIYICAALSVLTVCGCSNLVCANFEDVSLNEIHLGGVSDSDYGPIEIASNPDRGQVEIDRDPVEIARNPDHGPVEIISAPDEEDFDEDSEIWRELIELTNEIVNKVKAQQKECVIRCDSTDALPPPSIDDLPLLPTNSPPGPVYANIFIDGDVCVVSLEDLQVADPNLVLAECIELLSSNGEIEVNDPLAQLLIKVAMKSCKRGLRRAARDAGSVLVSLADVSWATNRLRSAIGHIDPSLLEALHSGPWLAYSHVTYGLASVRHSKNALTRDFKCNAKAAVDGVTWYGKRCARWGTSMWRAIKKLRNGG
jgi:hypothetical protein